MDDRAQRERDLAAYYDRESPTRMLREIDPERVARRAEFIDLLNAEGHRSVVEIGTGPGRDAVEFAAAGLDVSGVDLAPEHVRLSRDLGVDARLASVFDLPFADREFAAGWTMSTLLHIPNANFDAAMVEICRDPGAWCSAGHRPMGRPRPRGSEPARHDPAAAVLQQPIRRAGTSDARSVRRD